MLIKENGHRMKMTFVSNVNIRKYKNAWYVKQHFCNVNKYKNAFYVKQNF